MSKIIFVNRYFSPDHSATAQLLTDLSMALAEKGHEIQIITSRQLYTDAKANLEKNETIGKLQVQRIWTTSFGRSKLSLRALDYITFYIFALLKLIRITRSSDTVVFKTDPPMLSVLAIPLRLFCHAKMISWCQDLFPEVAIPNKEQQSKNLKNKAIFKTLKFFRDFSFRFCDTIIALGEDMSAYIEEHCGGKGKTTISENWFKTTIRPIDEEYKNCLQQKWGIKKHFSLAYSGNFGRVHDFDTFSSYLLELDQSENDDKDIQFLFIGGGALLERLKNLNQNSLHINYQQYQPREKLEESLSAADIHWFSLASDFTQYVYPSKFYGLLAMGKPLIFVGKTESALAKLIQNEAVGLIIEEGNHTGFQSAVKTLKENKDLCEKMSKNALLLYQNKYSFDKVIHRWENILLLNNQ